MAVCSDHAMSVEVPLSVVQELLADRCCPVHLRVQLGRAAEGREAAGLSHQGLGSLDGRLAMHIAGHLGLTDGLNARAVSTGLLAAVSAAQSTTSNGEAHADAELPVTECELRVHDRIRMRLWLRCAKSLAKRQPDETVFESHVASYIDSALRTRLEGELADARRQMETEVREAKLQMMQCIQTISDEVDRRVQEKVSALAEEFDRRADEQVKGICEMVERRVREQAEVLQAEVERRTDEARQSVERRAAMQEIMATKLQEEVAAVRVQLQTKVREQEFAAARLLTELDELRQRFAELLRVRDVLEAKANEALVLQRRPSAAVAPSTSSTTTCCWSWLTK